MKKNFIVAQSRKRPNGYFDCFAEKFSTKEDAQKYVEKLERNYLAGKNTDDIEIDGDQGILTKETAEECELPPPKRCGLPSNSSPDSARRNPRR